VRLDAESLHEFARLADADVRWFIISQNNLEFKKVPQLFDFVEVNACSPHQEQYAVLSDAADLAIRQGERLA
jgi:hypothetical protein